MLLTLLVPGLAEPESAASPWMARTLGVERITLPAGHERLRIEVDALGARVLLVGAPSPKRLAAALGAKAGMICDSATVEDDRVVLGCRTRRLEAALARTGQRLFLELREVRGLPGGGPFDAAPRTFWEPVSLGLGDACPGTRPFTRGECLLAEGRIQEAAPHFQAALEEPLVSQAAWIRLGDIALLTGDGILAADRYMRAGRKGIWARLGRARRCELFGSCLGQLSEASVFDAAGMPEPLRTELVVRGARALAFQGELAGAAAILGRDAKACAVAGPLCTRIALEALREPDSRMEGLGLYLGLPDRTWGPLAFELAQAAAEAAAAIGAPRFGADVLAAATDFAPASRLAAHLLRTAQLYVQSGDPVRAGVIVEFARGRLGQKALGSAPWRAVRASMESAPPPRAGPPPGEDAVEAALRAALEVEALLSSQENDTDSARGSQGSAPQAPEEVIR